MTGSAKKRKPTGKRAAPKKGRTKVEVSAGGIVFKRTPHGVRIALIMDPFGKWAFAKGHVEKGETLEEAAQRETREEMGLGRLKIVAPLGVIDFWFRDRFRKETKGVLVHKFVHYFLMEAPPKAKGQPQKKERIRKVVWLSLLQADRTSSYKDVAPMLRKVREYFTSGSRAAKRHTGRSRSRRGQKESRD